ncbi:unnamed protein product [Penicillium salamii]|uniref:Uncharacterized protein n=1 Tax=Penicillium salamii TaxID=1612424 RepID=A0A9W4JJN3_9EURO|nr:unnamed protein product [Penicillium salamii]CAG8279580.1 unnamed protein product [Penicillium salamii]CAG8395366.1 unnamed protein product [Penicillium salamii]
MRSSSILSVLSTLTLLLDRSLTTATPLAYEGNALNTTIEKRCANPCGYDGWLCCSSGQTCTTNSAKEAVCSDSGGSGSGGYQYYTTVYTLTETDLSTITSVWSSQIAAATSTGTCRADIGETKCGTRCCEAAQECQDGECVAESSSVAVTATGTDAEATPGVRGTSDGASTVTATSAPTTTEGFTAPVGTDGADLIGAKASDNDGGLSGGAIAGIVIGSIAGAFLLLLICACLCCKGVLDGLFAALGIGKRRKRDTTYVEERHSHHSHGGRPPPPPGRTWFGSKPPAEGSEVSEKKNSWGKIAIILGALALCLGLKRHRDKDHDDSKTESSYPSSYYYYSDYYSGTGSSRSSDRRTRDTRRSRQSRARSSRR